MTGVTWTRVTAGWCEAADCPGRRARWEGPQTRSGGNLWCGTCRRAYERLGTDKPPDGT